MKGEPTDKSKKSDCDDKTAEWLPQRRTWTMQWIHVGLLGVVCCISVFWHCQTKQLNWLFTTHGSWFDCLYCLINGIFSHQKKPFERGPFPQIENRVALETMPRRMELGTMALHYGTVALSFGIICIKPCFRLHPPFPFCFSLPDHTTGFSSIHGHKTVDCLSEVSNEMPAFPTITRNTSQLKHHQQQLQRRRQDIRQGPWHDVWLSNWVFWMKMTRHGRRNKSVWNPSSRVWEATTRAFWGSTRGSRTHRSRYGNRDERRCLFVRPSVVLKAFRIKMIVRIRTAKSSRHDNTCADDNSSSFVFWQRDIDQTADKQFE